MASESSGGLCKEINILYKFFVVMKPKLKKLELPSDFSVVTLGFLNLNMIQMFPCSVKGCFLRFLFLFVAAKEMVKSAITCLDSMIPVDRKARKMSK